MLAGLFVVVFLLSSVHNFAKTLEGHGRLLLFSNIRGAEEISTS